ncbi:hypothetical protein [Lacinutrix mariniflava]|uniref:hypothetical protein n=1 Tax=Lacinutrix mariniflava TaxID=342955 RepID=UPI0006E166F6|nr:hypothetical protein [Lacinutrix mariniflava]
MEENDIIKEQISEIVKNQTENNDPPETKITFKQLTKNGFSDVQSRQMIAQCVALELFEIIKMKKTFDNDRYVRNLKNLPKEPTE